MAIDSSGWLDETKAKLRRGNKVLFDLKSPLFSDLANVISHEGHKVMVLRALECASTAVETLRERYPDELRPQVALDKARAWAAGEVKMRVAQRAILDCHAVAKELDSSVDVALCHAIGQACGVVHANGHALGFPVYELTAIVLTEGVENCQEPVQRRVAEYLERIDYWRKHLVDYSGTWADFMERSGRS
jgi:hypothetical protein